MMKKYEFTGTNELSEKAFDIYSNSDFTFYKDGATFYGAYNSTEKPFELGALEDVEDFLLSFCEDDEEEIDLEHIKDLYEEKVEMETNNRGYIKMMLNKETAEIWSAFFVDVNSYIVYNTDEIVEIPVNDIIWEASDHILSNDEIAEAIKNWCEKEL